VANSGTALSTHQIHMLHRFTQNITLLYDGDEAGIHAAMRGTDMLLAEGMNIKVLLLPDGDDPDSFARKHSSEELKKYIEENQKDFIAFKSELTVENQTDPVKRSEGIAGIVKSISVIPEQILRDTYLTDFSHRIGMKEQTLIAEMNKYIRQDIEEKRKESERDGELGGVENRSVAPSNSIQVHPSTHPLSQVELLLVREIVRHGEEVIFEDVETDDGGHVSLTVAQYIDFDLSQDGLRFANELHNQILSEAVAHSGEEGFKAESYFTSHPDMNISRLATSLVIDRHQLGGRFVVQPREGSLRQRVLHLMMDFRLDLIENRLKQILQQMRQPGISSEQAMQLLQEHKETKELRDALAKRLGSDLIV
jgi:DNA primase